MPGSAASVETLGVHHDADGDGAVDRRPFGDRVGDLGIVGIDRLDQAEPAGMGGMDRERVARVVAVHGRTPTISSAPSTPTASIAFTMSSPVTSGGPAKTVGPRAARMIAFVAVNLGIDCRHERAPWKLSFGKGVSHFLAELAEPACHGEARLRRLAKASGLTH